MNELRKRDANGDATTTLPRVPIGFSVFELEEKNGLLEGFKPTNLLCLPIR